MDRAQLPALTLLLSFAYLLFRLQLKLHFRHTIYHHDWLVLLISRFFCFFFLLSLKIKAVEAKQNNGIIIHFLGMREKNQSGWRDYVPITKWLPEYSVKKNLINDIIGGVTVGILHVPQGTNENVLPENTVLFYRNGLCFTCWIETCIWTVHILVPFTNLHVFWYKSACFAWYPHFYP